MVIRRAQIHLKLSTEFGVFGNESYNHYWWGCILSYLVRRLWLITQNFNSLSQTSGDKVKQPISNNWGPISRMIHQVGHKVISFTNGLQITDIWNSTKQVTHKKSHIESHLKRIWMWKSDFTLQITPPYTIATNRTLWHHKTPALCKIYTLKPGNLQWQQWSELNLIPRALYYSASRVRWEGEDPGNQVGQSLVKDKIK